MYVEKRNSETYKSYVIQPLTLYQTWNLGLLKIKSSLQVLEDKLSHSTYIVREKNAQTWSTAERIISEFKHKKRGHHETLET